MIRAVVVCFAAFGLLALYLWSAPAALAIRFIDSTATSGIRAEMRCGSGEKRWIPEANGSGVAWLDYDNDGRMDLLIVNGSSIDDLHTMLSGNTPPSRPGAVYLFHNLGGGQFKDVTGKAGLKNPYWGTGANAVDFNNDGFTDILITNLGLDLLYRNNGDGTFTEVGKSAGLSREIAWHTGSAFGDYDNDGKLDLFVAGYVDVEELPKTPGQAPVCNYRGVLGFCGPKGLRGERDLLYHNNGDGTFTEIGERAGVGDSNRFHGFTAVFDDFNGDGKIDLFVANDSDPNYLYINQGDGTFKESGLEAGVGFNGNGETQANMGVAVGDFDGDGMLDLLTTTFSEDYFPLFRQIRPGFFEDVSGTAGLAGITIPWLGWACGFADFANDGRRDLWIVNGHVYPAINMLASSSYNQPIAIFRRQDGKFLLQPEAVPPLAPNSYRGAASGDFDNDGLMDLVIVPISGSPVLLNNRSAADSSWIGFQLRGYKSNRDGIGAKIVIRSCGIVQTDTVRNGGSYLSRNDPRVHFGLNGCREVENVSIKWPDGNLQTLDRPKPNRYIIVAETHGR